MGDWGSEAESSQALAFGSVQTLARLNPSHELVKYMLVPEGEAVTPESEQAIKIELKDRFWNREVPWQTQPGTVVVAVVYANYFLALESAIRTEQEKRSS